MNTGMIEVQEFKIKKPIKGFFYYTNAAIKNANNAVRRNAVM